MNPFILDFRQIDEARRRRDWHMALLCLIAAAALTAAIVGPMFFNQHTRILNAMCDVETVV